MHQNIQSLNAKQHELLTYLNTLNFEVQALALTEHWFKPQQNESFVLDGYNLAACYTRTTKTHGGSCIFLKDHIEFQLISEFGERKADGTMEGCGVLLPGYSLLICCIYRPPGDENSSAFFSLLSETLDILTNKYSKYSFLVCGDFNFDISQTKNRLVMEFLDIFKTNNLMATVHEATRVTEHSSTIIDNIFTNLQDNECTTQIVTTSLSDHHGQMCAVKLEKELPTNLFNLYEFRVLNESRLNTLSNRFAKISWSTIFSTKNASSSFDDFLDILICTFNEVCPKKIGKNKQQRKGWVSKTLKSKYTLKNTFTLKW